MKLEWRDVTIDGWLPAINTSLTANETLELQRLASGKRVLEIGSAFGYSTVILARVAQHVTAVDPHGALNSLETLRANLSAYGVTDKVTIHDAPSQMMMPALHTQGELFDLVWIDGDHEAPAVEHDITWGLELLNPNGVLACHDYDEDTCPGVRVAIDKVLGGPGHLIDTLSVHKGKQ
jgi:predicted O-methyltransferase YrrM